MIVEKAKPSAVTDDQRRAAVRMVKDGATLREAAAAFGVSHPRFKLGELGRAGTHDLRISAAANRSPTESAQTDLCQRRAVGAARAVELRTTRAREVLNMRNGGAETRSVLIG